MNTNALHQLSYGLFVLTTQNGEHPTGCIVNTVMQQTSDPLVLSVTVNKANYTNQLIKKTKELSISILDETCPFDIFKRFGFASGKDTDKFKDFHDYQLASNNTAYLSKYCNTYISGHVINEIDLSTHTIFFIEVTDGDVLSQVPSMTYSYYFKHVKPKAQPKVKGWVCKICGYVYEGEVLPDDFICPICKHGTIDFEKIV